MPATNEARAKAIVARLSEGTATAEDVFAAFEELDHIPADVVRSALEPWTGPAPDVDRLDDALRRAHRLPLRTPRLRVLSSMRDADILDLGDVAEAQIRAAGKTWDGLDLDAFDRLDGERAESFAGSLERRVLGESGDKPLFDAILFVNGAVVFRAGTTDVVAVVADQRVETTDKVARPALELALRDHIFAEHVEEEVPSTVSPVVPLPPVSEPNIDAPPPPSSDEPVPSTINVQVPTRDSRQVELPFDSAPSTEPSRPKKKKVSAKKKTAAVVEDAPAPKKKKAAAAPAKAPAKKKTATTKKKAAAVTKEAPAPKKNKVAAAPPKAPAKKKTATKKKSSSKA